MNPKDYTLEEWVKLWQEAQEADKYTLPEFKKKFSPNMPELPFTIPTPTPFPFNPRPHEEWWRRTYAEPTITTDRT